MRKLSMGFLTLPGVPPPELIKIAAAVGCSGVSLPAAPARRSLGGEIRYVSEDPALRKQTARALADTGLTLDLVESLQVLPDVDIAKYRTALEIMRDLGARRVNTSIWDPEPMRASDTLRALCDLTSSLEMSFSVEFMPLSRLASLSDAIELIRTGNYHGLKILVDALHLARAGETPEDLAKTPPELVAFAQICDGPSRSPNMEAYFEEAVFERQIPGTGQLPLHGFVAALPPDVVLAVEVPMRSLREQGVSSLEIAQLVANGARRVISGSQSAV